MFYRLNPLSGRVQQVSQAVAYYSPRGMPYNGAKPEIPAVGRLASTTTVDVSKRQLPSISADSVNQDLIKRGNQHGFVPKGYSKMEAMKQWTMEYQAQGCRTWRVSSADDRYFKLTWYFTFFTVFLFFAKWHMTKIEKQWGSGFTSFAPKPYESK